MLALAFIAVLAAPAAAQAPSPSGAGAGRASLTVVRPLTVSVSSRLRFGRLQPGALRGTPALVVSAAPAPAGAVRIDQTPAVTDIRGDPGRAYRIHLPDDVRTALGRHRVRRLTVWSATLGDVTRTRVGQLDAEGRDTLRVGGTLSTPFGLEGGVYTANVPLQIAYE